MGGGVDGGGGGVWAGWRAGWRDGWSENAVRFARFDVAYRFRAGWRRTEGP